MTYEEIVQALRCCAEGECKDCAMHEDKQRCQENLLDKAAEAIERLTTKNRALREKQRWIPVTERMPEEIKAPFTEDTMINLAAQALGVEPSRIRELAEADKDGRLVVLPCKVGERWADEDGRAVRITAVIVSIEPFGTNINIYFDYEDATPDDAGSDCVTNWDYFSRHYTCIEAERATEGATE